MEKQKKYSIVAGPPRRAILASSLALVFSGLFSGCQPKAEELDPDSSVTVGLLLPFTGASAATASNFERAVLLAAERVNEAGGIQGKPLRIVARDTHSDVTRSRKSVRELLDEGSVAIIGPESPEIAVAIRNQLELSEVPLISPFVGAGEEVTIDCTYPWYRLAPSARAMGENLANDLAEAGHKEIAILYGSGEYNRAFRRAVREKFESGILGGTVLIEKALEEGASSYSSEISEVLAERPDAIVLSASPQTGAVAFTEANLIGVGRAVWAFSPLLKTQLFLQNVDSKDAEGALGVAPKIFDSSDRFPAMFNDRWLGDDPLEGAYFYFDAVNLLTIALSLLGDIDSFDFEELKATMVTASSTRGVSVDWNRMDQGLDRIEEGIDVYYSGLTGPILLQECGVRRGGLTQAWTIKNGNITEVNR
jgi:branched-chain amino acid transport system substrate-binding protein